MTIRTKLSEKEYINASFTVIIARPFFRYFISLVFLILSINLIVSAVKSGISLATVIPPFLIFIIYAVVMYMSIKRGYSSNKRISETIEYIFEENKLIIQGESFKSEMSWDKIPKVTKTKKWILIWQSRQIANVIPGNTISVTDLSELKNILETNNVKNNL